MKLFLKVPPIASATSREKFEARHRAINALIGENLDGYRKIVVNKTGTYYIDEDTSQGPQVLLFSYQKQNNKSKIGDDGKRIRVRNKAWTARAYLFPENAVIEHRQDARNFHVRVKMRLG